MKNSIRKVVLRCLLCLLVAIGSYYSYKLYFEELIQEYFKSQVIKRMKQNFVNHENDFEEIVELSKDIEELRGFELYENNVISLRIYNYALEQSIENKNIWLLERNDSVFYDKGYYGGEIFVKNIEFLKDSSLVLNTVNGINGIEKFTHWEINYKGNLDNSVAKQIFNYQKIDFTKFVSFKKKLEKVNCHTYWKRDNFISLTYAGRYPFDYFAYDIYDKDSISTKYIIGKNYYCNYHLTHDSLINPTNWYGEGEVD